MLTIISTRKTMLNILSSDSHVAVYLLVTRDRRKRRPVSEFTVVAAGCGGTLVVYRCNSPGTGSNSFSAQLTRKLARMNPATVSCTDVFW